MAKLTFLDIDGVKRTIPELPLTDRPLFIAAREKVLDLISTYPPETPLTEMCNDSKMQKAIESALSYFQIDPQWISIAMAEQLLLSFDVSGGILWQIEFAY